ncbi:DivIVA domain-containing protein [Amycolatopsis orientalis]|uniref:DivIVA domain-containing protein n=1 Tax=Amycolatopsis orientalis TaxID=31958 RepID=UPI00039A0D8D|nr:DivIVA domain-containing protein [Amycolatopsis orientalis]
MAPGGGEDLMAVRPSFDLAWRGYQRGQVEEFVTWVEAEFQRLAAERDAAARQAAELAEHNRELRATIDRISRTPIAPDALQERSRRMVELTREEAAEITARAEDTAARIIADAKAEAVRLTKKERALVEAVAADREHQRREHEDLLRRAVEERKAADEAAAKERQRLEEHLTRTLADRRTDALREIADRTAAARAEADAHLRQATDHATRIVADAERRVAELVAVQQRVKAALRGARELLATANAELAPDATPVPNQRRTSPLAEVAEVTPTG